MTVAVPARHAVDEIDWPDSEIGSWYVLRTRSRQEKVLSKTLTSQGVRHFLPLSVQTKFYGGRKAKVEVPLFEGYLFLHGSLDDAFEADRTDRVAQIIQVKNQALLEEQLRSLRLALSSGASFELYPFLKRGV